MGFIILLGIIIGGCAAGVKYMILKPDTEMEKRSVEHVATVEVQV